MFSRDLCNDAQVTHVVVLGAGFSFAMSSQLMPLTDTLGNEIAERLRDEGVTVPAAFSGGRFEMWLSRLAEPQPDLDEVTNARNHALFLRISDLVREVLFEAETRTISVAPLWAFQRLIGALHARLSTVITFNYDTLIERLIESQWRLDWNTRNLVRGSHVIQGRPPVVYSQGLLGMDSALTFRLIKLHGSVDTFWVSGDFTGTTINRLGYMTRWTPMAESTHVRRLTLPGRIPFIVPPAAAKSAFYANPFTRQLWRDASEALASAEVVDIVGYSMPTTDLVTSGMLGDTLATSASAIRVVNKYPDHVVTHLESLGCDRDRIQVFGGDSAIAKYIDAFEREFDPLAGKPGDVERQLAQESRVMVGLNLNEGAAVVGVVRDESDPTVARVRIEQIGDLDWVNRPRETTDPQVISVADLFIGNPPRRIIVEFDTGTEAMVVDVAGWVDDSRHPSMPELSKTWLRLLPSAMPWTLIPGPTEAS